MTTLLQNLNATAERWVRLRFAFPLVVTLAAALLLVSEITYRNTTSTLRGGIELTDARIEATRLLQLLSDAETAQFAFLVTGDGARLSEYDRVRAELRRVQSAVAVFFATLGPQHGAAYQRAGESTARAIAQFDRTLGLARNGQLDRALALARNGAGLAEVQAARSALLGQFAEAAGLQQQARMSLFDAFRLNRLAVGVLTVVAVASLFLFMRQLHTQDRERAAQRAALLRERENLEIDVARRTERLTDLTRHLQSVREDERAYLARELHDELGGLLTASKLDLARTRAKAGDPTEVLVRLDRLNDNLNKGIALKRRIIEDLRPSALSNFGLVPALQTLCVDMSTSLDIPVHLDAAPFVLSPEAELAVYRFVQESLTNIGKYARANAVHVTLRVVGNLAVAEVHDDGIGFDPLTHRVGHHGLAGMQFRAESLGGTMSVRSAPGAGTTLHIEFPQARSADLATTGAELAR